MNCANHPDVAVSQYCRTCGKPLCAACVRNVQGVAYCEQCLAERLGAVQPPQAANAAYVAPPMYPAQPVAASGPNPALAGILSGFFPFGVGAVYNGQYSKGLAQLVIMTLLIWGLTAVDGTGLTVLLALGLGFFYIYQIIDAVRSAHSIRAGLPAPDPFGLTGMFGGWESRTQASASAAVSAVPGVQGSAGVYTQPRIPTAAVILIALGCLFLLRTAGIFDYDEDLIWPFVLIALGVFILIRRRNAPPNALDRSGRPVRRSLTGSAVLITIGTLVLIEHLHGPSFHRTWPLLLLIIGLVRLLDSKNPNAWNAGSMPMPPVPPMPPGTSTDSTSGSEVNRG